MGRACGTDRGNVKFTLFTMGHLERKRPFIALHATEGIILVLNLIFKICVLEGARGGVVVKALRYKPAGRGFDSQ
jgi:hypothetical protein